MKRVICMILMITMAFCGSTIVFAAEEAAAPERIEPYDQTTQEFLYSFNIYTPEIVTVDLYVTITGTYNRRVQSDPAYITNVTINSDTEVEGISCVPEWEGDTAIVSAYYNNVLVDTAIYRLYTGGKIRRIDNY